MFEDLHKCEECGGCLELINSCVDINPNDCVFLYRCKLCKRFTFMK